MRSALSIIDSVLYQPVTFFFKRWRGIAAFYPVFKKIKSYEYFNKILKS